MSNHGWGGQHRKNIYDFLELEGHKLTPKQQTTLSELLRKMANEKDEMWQERLGHAKSNLAAAIRKLQVLQLKYPKEFSKDPMVEFNTISPGEKKESNIAI